MDQILSIKPNPFTPVAASSSRQLPKNRRSPRPSNLPSEPGPYRPPLNAQLKENQLKQPLESPTKAPVIDEHDEDSASWSSAELDAISALFARKMPQKRPTTTTKPPSPKPLPLPHRKPLQPSFPTPKRHLRLAALSSIAPRASVSDQVRKNPEALIGIARAIGALDRDSDVSEVLDGWSRFLRKGSLSMTIRELGHMGLPDRALHTFLWAQNHRPELFPDDRTLASTVEVLARHNKLKLEFELESFLNSASRAVLESMARGFIKGGNFNRARSLLLIAHKNNRRLDPSVYAKLIHEAGRNPDGYRLASVMLDELAERDELDLRLPDCTAVMKVCIKLKRFEAVERLFSWFKGSGRDVSLVMYTTVVYSRYCERKYREGLALVWEMEGLNLVLDLPAYRVIIRLCAALNDVERAARYFSRLKEAGFLPSYDIYRDIIHVYGASRRLAKCRQICKEVDMAGLRLDKGTSAFLLEIEAEAE